jgi:hypothetical protein
MNGARPRPRYAETVIPQQGQTPVPILLQRLVDD